MKKQAGRSANQNRAMPAKLRRDRQEIVRRLLQRGMGPQFPGVLPFGIGRTGGRSVVIPEELASIWYPPGPRIESPLIDRQGATYLRPPQNAYLLPGQMTIEGGKRIMGATRIALGREEEGERFLGVKDLEALTQHFYILGPTGSGKTQLQLFLLEQWVRMGRAVGGPLGMVFIDAKGTAIAEMAQYIPYDRENYVLWFDPHPFSSDYVIPFNPLDYRLIAGADAETVAGGALETLEVAVGGWQGTAVGMEEVLRMAMKAIAAAEERPTIQKALDLIADDAQGENAYRERLMPRLREREPEVAAWFDNEYPKREIQSSAVAARRRFRKLLLNNAVKHFLSVEESVLDFARIADEGLILMAEVTRDLGQDVQGMIGAMLFQGIVAAGRQRFHAAKLHPEKAKAFRKFVAMVDEFQAFSTLRSLEEMLSQMRAAMFCLGLAHQYADQVASLLKAIFGNVGSKIIFPLTSADDAKLIARHTAGVLTDNDLLGARLYHPYVQVHGQGWYGLAACQPVRVPEEDRAMQELLARPVPEFRWPVDRERDELDEEADRLRELSWMDAATELAALPEEQFKAVLGRVKEWRRVRYRYICEHPGAQPDKVARIKEKSNLHFGAWRAEIQARLMRRRAETVTANAEELGAWWQ